MTLDKTIKQLTVGAVFAVGMASTPVYGYDSESIIRVKYVYGSSSGNAYFAACNPYDTKGMRLCQSLAGNELNISPANNGKKSTDTIYDESWVIGHVYDSSFEIKDKQLQRKLKIEHAREWADATARVLGELTAMGIFVGIGVGDVMENEEEIYESAKRTSTNVTESTAYALTQIIKWYYEPEKNNETLAPSSKSARIGVDLVYNGNGAAFLQRCTSYDETGAAYCKAMHGKWIGTPWLRGNSPGYSKHNELAVGPTSHGTMGVMKYEPPTISAAPSRSSSSPGSSSSSSSSSQSSGSRSSSSGSSSSSSYSPSSSPSSSSSSSRS